MSDEAMERIRELDAGGLSFSAIARVLNDEQVPTARRGRWFPSSVARVVQAA